MAKKYSEGRVTIKKSHIFNLNELREILTPGKEVMFFPESIIKEEIMDVKTKLIRIVTEQLVVCYVPLWILDFSDEVKKELILRRKLKEKDFETIHVSDINSSEIIDDGEIKVAESN